jgi:hypothetical protein
LKAKIVCSENRLQRKSFAAKIVGGQAPSPREQVTTSTRGLSIADLQVAENKTNKHQTSFCSKKHEQKKSKILDTGHP